jgi:MFS family permease
MVGWLRELNAKERKTMWGCFGGWSLDAFDVQMYSFVIPTVISLRGLSRGEAGLIGTVTLLISSLGGWFSGTLADKFGRVKMLQITILWYSFFTFLCAFAINFETLFALRALRAADRAQIGTSHLFAAFRGPHFWTTVKVSLMVAGAQGGGYALSIWMPTICGRCAACPRPALGAS